MNWIGIDVGGANIKVVWDECNTRSVPFPLWKKKTELTSNLTNILGETPASTRLAVTMTGELADCFESKQEGVRFIVESVETASAHCNSVFYQTTGLFVSAADAIANWQKTAAANWHALATYAARFMDDQTGILIDIGSTTTDVIPVFGGKPCSRAVTDIQRLQSGELVYTGISRSPVNGLLRTIKLDGKPTHVANEMFATTLDAHVYLENIAPSTKSDTTADGRPATIPCASKRLARVVCADSSEISAKNIGEIANAVVAAQVELISKALDNVLANYPDSNHSLVISGSGDWLAKRILDDRSVSLPIRELGQLVSQEMNDCAPAFAVRKLAQEQAAVGTGKIQSQ